VTGLPDGFADLEHLVADWARPTRQERYARRLAATMPELEAFYDAVAPRAEEAIAYLDGFALRELPEDARQLLRLLYSLVLVSYAVNVFHQPRIPDAGAAFFDCATEPAI
jgi:hypothetical protein